MYPHFFVCDLWKNLPPPSGWNSVKLPVVYLWLGGQNMPNSTLYIKFKDLDCLPRKKFVYSRNFSNNFAGDD